ncbi:hypothetical protein LXL04_000306 [Taraxacum kok-saghyz]
MSSEEVKKVSPQDLQLVQNLIERCLQLYMSQKEVVSTLLHQAKIEPSFTELVWQKLEEENQDFFKAYHLRLILKDQIMKFNKLLQTQADLMHQISPPSVPISNGSHVPLLHQNPSSYGQQQDMKVEAIHGSTVGQLSNNGSTLHPCMQPSRRDDVSSNLLMSQNSNMGVMVQGMNGNGDGNHGMIKSETAAIPSFIGEEESNPKPNVDPDSSSYGFLGQIPRNFSLSDLTADFSISSDILDNYSRSPYLAADTEFLNPHSNNNGDIQQGEGKRLDTISEGLSYEGFGSD